MKHQIEHAVFFTTENSSAIINSSSQLDLTKQSVGPAGNAVSVLLIVTGVFALVCNALTIAAIVTTPQLNTQTNRYILHLAVADSIVGVAAVWWSFNYMDFSFSYFNHLQRLCLFGYVLFFVSVTMSLVTLTLLSVDRLLYVERPYLYCRVVTERVVSALIACSWLLSLLYGICVPVFENVFSPVFGCLMFTVLSRIANKIAVPVPFVMLVCITSFCYVRIAYLARRHRKRLSAETQNLGQTQQGQQQGQCGISCNSSRKEKYSLRFKSTGVFVIINCLFLFCWTPLVVCSAVLDQDQATNRALGIASFLAMSNSCMNFIVLASRNKEFARAYKRLLRRGQ